MTDIVVWGTGQISQVLSYYLENCSDFKIRAYCVDGKYLQNDRVFNAKPIVAFEDIEKFYPPAKYKMALIMGYKNLNKYREQRYLQAKEKGYSFISYVGPNSVCDGEIGENTFIFAFNNIQPFSKVGNNVIIWTHTCIGHHSVISDNCFLASPVIAGCSQIEKNCFLGINSTVCDHVKIGEYSIIGAGTCIKKNIKPYSVIAAKQSPKSEFKSTDMEDILK